MDQFCHRRPRQAGKRGRDVTAAESGDGGRASEMSRRRFARLRREQSRVSIDGRAYGLELIGAVADRERGQNGAILSDSREDGR
jgi:hypothetical protein